MNIRDYPNLKDLLLEIMSGRAIKEVGDFDILRIKLKDQIDLSDAYIGDMDLDEISDLQDYIKSTFEMPMVNIKGLRSIGSSLEDDVMNHLIYEIDINFMDEMQPILDAHWEDQRGE